MPLELGEPPGADDDCVVPLADGRAHHRAGDEGHGRADVAIGADIAGRWWRRIIPWRWRLECSRIRYRHGINLAKQHYQPLGQRIDYPRLEDR